MVAVDAGTIASCLCFICSLCTLALGVLFLVLTAHDLRLEFSDCGFLEEDCNRAWRHVFTFRPEIVFDLWTPIVIGTLGICIHLKSVKFSWVANYVQYSLFMLVNALFANFGYCGQGGILLGALSLLAVVGCIVARLTGEKVGLKTLDIGR
eukprot:CAMPEP_0197886604 /NCGR_PEP_ID=MMETSP1439-20131203/16974_1 /TAXON_ID=66791 /ORGANISM="Gonyaulax spinifera, Strain CCMP409" /LENGTH=150 /DNA_ID=CAMNT_0043506411 /DNA_START=88 /DNA_END=540 /DNA_ORIENTATION=-